MNQRIRELHSQCKVCDKDTVLYFDYERFAESIVQECVWEIKMTMVRDGYDTKHYLQSRKHIEHICKHFGVEE